MEYQLLTTPPKEIDDFFKSNLANSHPKISYSRLLVAYWFSEKIKKSGKSHFNNGCVISGTDNEPELKFVKFDNYSNLSFEADQKYDLDKDWSLILSSDYLGKFDFVICNQVLEHISNPLMAFKNFSSLLRPGGFVFVSVPVLNCIHGEPYFFSSGYHPRLLDRHATDNQLSLVDGAYWGTYKYAIHAINGRWCTSAELRPGFRSFADIKHPFLSLTDGRNAKSRFASLLGFRCDKLLMTDCWALYTKLSEH